MKALKAGDKVAFVAPSSPVEEKFLRAGEEALEKRGFKVEYSPTILSRRGYLAGDDERRAGEFDQFARRDDIRAIFIARGGYGILRILNMIDFSPLAIDPRPVIGFSDSTALISYLSTRMGLFTMHGCMPATSAVMDDDSSHLDMVAKILRDEITYPYVLWKGPGALPGKREIRGRIFGGCLSVVISTIGTPYEPYFEGGIIFLEEVDEKAYRIDRKMTQLRLSGHLEEVEAAVLGRFVPVPGERSQLLEDIAMEACDKVGVPVFRGFPAGHMGENMPIPLGVPVSIAGEGDMAVITIMSSPFES